MRRATREGSETKNGEREGGINLLKVKGVTRRPIQGWGDPDFDGGEETGSEGVRDWE